LDEDGYVFDHGAEGADQPGEVGEYVLLLLRVEDDLADVSRRDFQQSVDVTYPCTICSIAQKTQHEEQQRQALARLLSLVLNDLRNARSKISHGACVSQDHGTNRVIRGVLRIMLRLRNPHTSLPRDSPACSTNNTNTHDAQRILNPLARAIAHIRYRRQRTRAPSAASRRIAPVASRQTDVAAIASAQQGRFNAVCRLHGGFALAAARVLHVVVYALRDEDEVCEAEVDCEGDDGGDEASPEGTSKVRYVADEPDDEEGEGDAISGG